MSVHESGYGGTVTTTAGYQWEGAATGDVQDWTFTDEFDRYDVTLHGGRILIGYTLDDPVGGFYIPSDYNPGGTDRQFVSNVNRLRSFILGTEQVIQAEMTVLVPADWAASGTGYKSGVQGITASLFKNGSEKIVFSGFIDRVVVVSPLDNATLMRMKITGDGSQAVYS